MFNRDVTNAHGASRFKPDVFCVVITRYFGVRTFDEKEKANILLPLSVQASKPGNRRPLLQEQCRITGEIGDAFMISNLGGPNTTATITPLSKRRTQAAVKTGMGDINLS